MEQVVAKRVLVVGAGAMGSALARTLRDDGMDVTVADAAPAAGECMLAAPSDLAAYLRERPTDVVALTVPYGVVDAYAAASLQAGVRCVDSSAVQPGAGAVSTPVPRISEAGFAPGLILRHLVAEALAGAESVIALRTSVTGMGLTQGLASSFPSGVLSAAAIVPADLPRDHGPMGLRVTWTPRGVLQALERPATLRENRIDRAFAPRARLQAPTTRWQVGEEELWGYPKASHAPLLGWVAQEGHDPDGVDHAVETTARSPAFFEALGGLHRDGQLEGEALERTAARLSPMLQQPAHCPDWVGAFVEADVMVAGETVCRRTAWTALPPDPETTAMAFAVTRPLAAAVHGVHRLRPGHHDADALWGTPLGTALLASVTGVPTAHRVRVNAA